ncbi:hypothetical protein [Tsuneonella dongtanensis]|nr:hypothetical protein [Tsuneonella dongtanensis]
MSRYADLARAAALGLALVASPAFAQDADDPVMNRTPDAEDVAMTPITDLNLKKDEIPSVLLAAGADPYASVGIRNCKDIAAAIAPLDAALGPDMDIHDEDGERISAGAVAKSVVASFIPFRGILRELTGAADHKREFEAAIYAGAVRRGFLKGLGQQKGCAYPARPAAAKIAAKPAKAKKVQSAGGGEPTTFVSEPVVQGEKPEKSPNRRRR